MSAAKQSAERRVARARGARGGDAHKRRPPPSAVSPPNSRTRKWLWRRRRPAQAARGEEGAPLIDEHPPNPPPLPARAVRPLGGGQALKAGCLPSWISKKDRCIPAAATGLCGLHVPCPAAAQRARSGGRPPCPHVLVLAPASLQPGNGILVLTYSSTRSSSRLSAPYPPKLCASGAERPNGRRRKCAAESRILTGATAPSLRPTFRGSCTRKTRREQ